MSNQLPKFPEPYWRDHVDLPEFDSLKTDESADVVIVGGGITGITAAYLLSKEGKKVVLLEASNLLNGTTGHTTAKITAQHDLIYDEFIQHIGRSKARLYYESNSEALQFIKQIIHENELECDLKTDDAILYATSEEYAHKLEKEYEAYKALHIDGKLVHDIPFPIDVHNALAMKNQAQFHPLQYLKHLVQAIIDNGGRIYENTTAVNVEGIEATVLTRNDKRITCDYVLACSHFPFYEGTGFYSTRMHADRSYAIAVQTNTAYPGGMYLSVDQPSRSLRSATMNGEEIVIVGGESHKTGQGKDTLEHYKALQNYADDLFEKPDFLYRWSAQDLITLDKLPYIGEITSTQPNVLVATGFRKWGMTNGTAAALLLRDIVLDKENPYKELYTPSRFYADPSLKNFFMENTDVAKHLIKGKLETPATSIEDLSRDEGAVFKANGQRKGAYKDENGEVYIVDTTCTHVGCEVEWNHGDRTWDCPCHGSRFSYKGEVIEGPAEKPLQQHDHTMLENLTSENSGY
ncbi:FAD-dependent oxidoreductase [Salibacterium salarium]|uniref:FAD-dependent oxidoreductase n=1 Tax=Salibacterium salarium TaxID=284579 RepID=A0A3R9QM24_9BACI|nr:FAD-dependent oxidoreductase [Salibacterium salarium]RSL33343.1 FAD-dependent oxidoreductase [Salibacterium salarium]